MYKYKTPNFLIINYEKPISKKELNTCIKSYQKNKSFFEKDAQSFKIIICNSEKVYKKYSKYRYFPWTKGCRLRNNSVVIRTQSEILRVYKKFGGSKRFDRVLTHEINHVFAAENKIRKGPYWLFEGIATFVANPNGKSSKLKFVSSDLKSLIYRYNPKKVNNNRVIYPLSYSLVKYLVKTRGIKSLKRLLNSITEKTKKDTFEKNFKKIVGKTEKLFIQEFFKKKS